MRSRVVINPKAGNVADLAAIEEALAGLPDTEVCVTAGPGDAEALARQAAERGDEEVVAAGGDGTLNEVVNGLMTAVLRGPRPRLGLLPLGTGNDFARTIRVPADLPAALQILARGRTAMVDVGHLTAGGSARWFVNVSAGGFSGLVDEKLDSEVKHTWGPLSYLRTAIEALPALSVYEVTIVLDEDETLELRVYSVVVANGRYVAAGVPVAPASRLDDGLFDLVVVPEASVPQLAALVPLVLLGRHTESPHVVHRRAARLTIHSRPAMWFNADGELVARGAAAYDLQPRALEVVVGWGDGLLPPHDRRQHEGPCR